MYYFSTFLRLENVFKMHVEGRWKPVVVGSKGTLQKQVAQFLDLHAFCIACPCLLLLRNYKFNHEWNFLSTKITLQFHHLKNSWKSNWKCLIYEDYFVVWNVGSSFWVANGSVVEGQSECHKTLTRFIAERFFDLCVNGNFSTLINSTHTPLLIGLQTVNYRNKVNTSNTC